MAASGRWPRRGRPEGAGRRHVRLESGRAGGGRPTAGPTGAGASEGGVGRQQGRAGGGARWRLRPAAEGASPRERPPEPIRGKGGCFFFENMSKGVPRGNRVISSVESHLPEFHSCYLLMAHGRKGIGVKISWRQNIQVQLKK